MRKQEETRLEDLAAEKAQYLANQSLIEIVSTSLLLLFFFFTLLFAQK